MKSTEGESCARVSFTGCILEGWRLEVFDVYLIVVFSGFCVLRGVGCTGDFIILSV